MTSENFRIPVVSTPEQVEIPWPTLKTIISGNSVLDLNSIHIKNKQEAFKFLKAYGFDLEKSGDRDLIDQIKNMAFCQIPLVKYQIKEIKSLSRIMQKLLRKPGNLAVQIYDHLGVQFVTYDIYSAILLIKFLRSRHIISYVNNVPELSKNSLADFEEIQALYESKGAPFIQRSNDADIAKGLSLSKENPFSSRSFHMIKFVDRLLVPLGENRRVFFPYEIQIFDKTAWDNAQRGPNRHDHYEKRQLASVQRRLFGNPVISKHMKGLNPGN